MQFLRTSAIALPFLLIFFGGNGHTSAQEFDWKLRAAEITKRTTASSNARITSKPRLECHPSYSDICIPKVVADLDCRALAFGMFINNGSDPHRLDSDKDGVACEDNISTTGAFEQGTPFCIVVSPVQRETRVVAQWGERYAITAIPISDDTYLINGRIPTAGKEIIRVSQRGGGRPLLRDEKCTSVDASNNALVNVSWEERPLIADVLWQQALETSTDTPTEKKVNSRSVVKSDELASSTTPLLAQEAGSFVTFDDGRAFDLTGLWGSSFSKPVIANIVLTR